MVGHGALIAATPEEAVAKAAQTQSRLSKKKAKQLRRRVRNAIPRPWRFEPPKTKAAPPDRDMSKGIEGVISFGDVATGTGAFAKAAMKQGMVSLRFELDEVTRRNVELEKIAASGGMGPLEQVEAAVKREKKLKSEPCFFATLGGIVC